MKHTSLILLSIAYSAYALAAPKPTAFLEQANKRQTASSVSIPPPPAESTGCELHIDHYHCEGPASVAAGAASGTVSVPAPPAESTGCVLHDDHYHCEGPATGHNSSDDDHDHDDHDDHDHDHVSGVAAGASGSVSIPPPPAESTGCVVHGDHYHCEGPASSGGASSGVAAVSQTSASGNAASSATSIA